jgi:frataxin
MAVCASDAWTGEVEVGPSVVRYVIIITAPGKGGYILMHQHPTKQIWLSSPVLGSKAYDWVVDGEKQHVDDGVTMGQWLQLTDGTNLSEVLNTELGSEMEMYFG